MKDITVQEFICNDSECECLSRSECKRIWISDKNMSERNDLKYKNMSANETLKQGLEYMKSPEGQKSMEDYFNKLAQRDAIEQERAQKLLEMYGVCDDSTFDYLMLDILVKQEKYDKRHYSTYAERPLHLMNLMWEIASKEGVEIDPIDGLTENFSSMVYDYYGYQFAITHGQGSVLSVYRQNELRYRS